MAANAESPQIASRLVTYIAAGLVAALVGAVASLALSFPETMFRAKAPVSDFPAPAVRTDERAQRLSIESMQRNRLKAGIPIERAMDIIVARGRSAYDPITGPTQ